MATGPLNIEPDVIHSRGGRISAVAEEASAELARSRSLAVTAQPGFPGDAAGPFQSMVNALTTRDRALVSALDSAGANVTDAAGTYEYCEMQNVDQLRNPRLEF